jgi:hypothetical protein
MVVGTQKGGLLQYTLAAGRNPFSSVADANSTTATYGLTIWPNPSQGLLNLACQTGSIIKIYNSVGVLVHQTLGQASLQQLNVSYLAKGVYTVIENHPSGNRYGRFILN